jgi:hypothetical protein
VLRPNMIIPALNTGCLEKQFKQLFPDHLRTPPGKFYQIHFRDRISLLP